MQRNGTDKQKGLIFVLNNRGEWNGTVVKTKWPVAKFTPVAWKGSEVPDEELSDAQGTADFWAPPRGYTVYVPA
jgi:alpha-amylase